MTPPSSARATEAGRQLPGALAARQLDRRPEGVAQPKRRSALIVISAQDALEHARRRRAKVLVACSVAIVVVAMLVVALFQGMLASEQLRLDAVSSQLGTAVATNQELELRRAELASPSRILEVATHDLGMVMPPSVVYLPAVVAASSQRASSTTAVGRRPRTRARRSAPGHKQAPRRGGPARS